MTDRLPGAARSMLRGGGIALALLLLAGSSRIGAAGDAVPVRADFDPARPVGYTAQVGPTLSLLGCNAGSCHGKSGGQHGFALSLFGFDPEADFRAIRSRVDPLDPEASLFLRKPSGQVPHGGGRKLAEESVEYQALARWIGELGRAGSMSSEPKLVRLDVQPARQFIARGGQGRVRVEAAWDDGAVVDVSRLCRFETSGPLVEVDATGGVATRAGIGEATILIRYGVELAVARVVVPTGATIRSPEFDAEAPLDRLVARKLDELGMTPAGLAPDAEFARRAALDITGRLPDPDLVAAYERDRRPDKRTFWVNALLDRPEYADFFATKWSAILRNRRALGDLSKPTTFAFHAWLREAIAENQPYDRFAAAIIAAKGDAASCPPVGWYRNVATVEERTDDAAQVFLGTRIGCARCHHHPTERWTPDDHADFAAFFTRIGTKMGPDPSSFRVFAVPASPGGHGRTPRPLGAAIGLPSADRDDPRDALVRWMIGPEDPYFARAVVNRYWKHFFGRGLVEPEDDLRVTNPATDPELLDWLAADFRAQGFDLKRLIRTIATSATYARSSAPDPSGSSGPDNYARFAPRRLSAEVLLDAIDTVTGTAGRFAGMPAATRAVQLPDDGFASPFLDAFGRPARRTACECERSAAPDLSQALALLNSGNLEARLADPAGRAARYASAADPRPDAAKVAELYRIALARPPSAAEQGQATSYLGQRRESGRVAAGFEDLIWALINTKEFLFNH